MKKSEFLEEAEKVLKNHVFSPNKRQSYQICELLLDVFCSLGMLPPPKTIRRNNPVNQELVTVYEFEEE